MRNIWRGAGAAVVVAAATLGGCDSGAKTAEPESVVRNTPAPGYSSVAARYNDRVGRFEQFKARTVVRFRYTDADGKERLEQGEGLLQVIRPDRLAMSIKKAGKMLFWFGGDAERYWLFDVVDAPVARVGRHDRIAARKAGSGGSGLGIEINPKELVRLLGITPLPIVGAPGAGGKPTAEPGTTAWSKDGRSVEVRTPIPGGTQVVALDPDTFFTKRITLLDAKGAPFIWADHETFEPVDIANYGGVRPKAASRVTATHPASKTEIKIDLAEMRNSGVLPKAFMFDALREDLGVEKVIDLDAPPPKASPKPAPAGVEKSQ
jgi:hypothetical protein